MCRMLHDSCHILCYDGSKAQELNEYTNGNRNHGENNMDIEMSNGRSWFRKSDHARSMIRLTM